ncbi:MAG: hypothetical protein KKB31_01125 [Nanoarchaeota archaeon]|nr:hypothetical protein [Nanoarchaeota archaeon]
MKRRSKETLRKLLKASEDFANQQTEKLETLKKESLPTHTWKAFEDCEKAYDKLIIAYAEKIGVVQ